MTDPWAQLAKDILPGAVGSFGALFWVNGGWKRKLGLGLLGGVAAMWGGPYMADLTSIPPELAGFLVGLFGMSIVDKMMSSWYAADLASLFVDGIRRLFGLPPKG